MTPPRSKAAPSEAERPDRATVLLDHAGENDIVQFSEQNGALKWTYLPPRWEISDVRALGIEEFAAEHFGGGTYKVGLRDRSNGVYGKSAVIYIGGAPKTAAERAQILSQRIGGTVAGSSAAPASTRGSYELPTWVEKIMVPAAVALVAGITNKLLADPKTDPLVVELLKRTGKGDDGPSALEVQQTITAAEERGERRGREFGELKARVERRGNAAPGEGSGVVDAIREAAPIFNRLIDRAREGNGDRGGERVRRALPAGTAGTSSTNITSSTPPTGEAAVIHPTAADIVPAWLRPFTAYQGFLIQAADRAASAAPIAGMVIENVDDATWAAIAAADKAGRLEEDLFAAIPALRATDRRREFVAQLLEDLRTALKESPPEEPGDARDVRRDEPAAAPAPTAAVAAAAPKKTVAKKQARARG